MQFNFQVPGGNMTETVYDSHGAPVEQFNKDQLDAWQHVTERTAAARNGIATLDLSDDKTFGFLTGRFGGDERLKAYFPQYYKSLLTTRRHHAEAGPPAGTTLLEQDDPDAEKWHPYVTISYLNVTPDNKNVLAQGIITLPNDATSVAISLTLYDEVAGKVIAEETLPAQYNTLTQQIEAAGHLDDIENMRVVATLVATYQPAGSPYAIPITKVSTLDGSSVIQQITVLNPNHNNHPERDYIKVCLGRGDINTADCDYIYNYGYQNNRPVIGVSVEGYAQLVQGFTFADPANISGSCVLRRRSAVGDGATVAFPPDKIPDLTSASGTVINWNIGPDWFQGVPWDQNQTIDLEFVLNFDIQNVGLRHLSVTSVPPAVGLVQPTNIASIDPLQFVWGCVAETTPVLLASGETRTALDIRTGQLLASPDGPMEVVRVWHGREDKPMARLITSCGSTPLVTDEHPILTPEGMRLPKDLKPGQILSTRDGETTLVAVEWARFDGLVINYDLAPPGEAFDALPDDRIIGFYADGLAVGDNRMQGLCADAARVRPVPALADYPAEVRLDVLNGRRARAGLPPVSSMQTL